MTPQRSGSGEAFVADTAAIRFDPRVASHVRLHVLEPLLADAAGPAGLSVGLQVSPQTVRRLHMLSTNAADASRVPAVCLSVFPQEPLAVEEITADSAAERGRPRRPQSRALQSVCLWFLCLADLLTLVSIILSVGLQVILEQLDVSEGLSTDRTDISVGPAVDLLVPPQRSRSGEALTTDVAAERFDSRVAPHVRLHVLKRPPADVARPRPADGFSVTHEMF